jgi:outer membrane immunogenic protein
MGNVVFGIEGDVDAHHWNASRTAAGAGIPTPFVAGDNFTASGDWQASLRGRLGYALDRTLLYVTGGVAWTDVKVGTNFIAIGGFPGSSASDSKVVTGGTIGGGLEYAFTRNWSAGIEGRFTWYGTETYNGGTLATFGIPTTGPFAMAPVSQSLRLSTSEILGKLNFRF